MTEAQNSEGPRRYCTNCGADRDPSVAFCTSCGRPIEPNARGPAWSAMPNASDAQDDPADRVGTGLRSVFVRFGAVLGTARVVLILACVFGLIGLLLLFSPLVAPLLGTLGPIPFLLPLVVTAVGVVFLLLDDGGAGGRVRKITVAALTVYLFVGLYRAVLEHFSSAGARGALGVGFLVLAALGALLAGGSAGAVASARIPGPLTEMSAKVTALIGSVPWTLKVLATVLSAILLLLVLSPYAFVLCGALLLAGAVALGVRAYQRKPLGRAGFVALSSAALAVCFGVVSFGIYGATVNTVPGAVDDAVPEYEVVATEEVPGTIGYSEAMVQVFASSLSDGDLEGIAEDIPPQLRGYDHVVIWVWDQDRATYDPSAPFSVRVSEGTIPSPEASISLALTAEGAAPWETRVGEYEINRSDLRTFDEVVGRD